MKYEAWIHWLITDRCYYQCPYCLGSQFGGLESAAPVNIAALLKNLNGAFYRIGFSGGEPFVVPNFVETCGEVTKDHVISINSNFTHRRVQDFIQKISPERVVEITASLHYTELEYRGLFERYISNFIEARNKGFEIRCEQPAFPPLSLKVDEIRYKLEREGIEIRFVPFNLGEFRQKYSFQGDPCNAGYNACIVTTNGDMFRCSDVHQK